MEPRRRNRSFHEDNELPREKNMNTEDNEVKFITPMYGGDVAEPLDLSKLCLDDDLFDKDEVTDGDDGLNEEETFTRGRSRSRSVHANDDIGPDAQLLGMVPPPFSGGDGNSCDRPPPLKPPSHHSPSASDSRNDKTERTGPLQHKEIQALKKGLEEATHSLNRQQTQEDEEERVAADAEKRKRLMGRQNSGSADDNLLRRVKILMLGDSGVGKSSLMTRWTLDTFKTSLASTVGVNFKSRKVKVNDEYIQVQVWDTAGQEQFHKITTSYYKGAQAIMLVYDITDSATLDNVEYWVKNIKAHASDTVQVVLVGNKTDLRHQDAAMNYVETQQGHDVALKFGIPFFETSAKDALNVDSAFTTLVEHTMQTSIGASPPRGQYFPTKTHSSATGAAAATAADGGAGSRSGSNDSTGSRGNNSKSFGRNLSRKSIESGVNKILGSIPTILSRENNSEKKVKNDAGSTSTLPPPPSSTSPASPPSSNIAPSSGGGSDANTKARGKGNSFISQDEKEKCVIS